MSVQSPGPGVHDPRSISVVTPTRLKGRQKLLAALIYLLVRAASATWRCHAEDQSGLIQSGQNGPVIFGLWHNRLALSMMIWGHVRKKQPTAKLVALTSASQDGGILSRVLGHFGVQAVRGSSSRRGPQALLELTSWVEQGYHIAITPDGPRGPRYVAQEGIIALAQVTGCPIIPVSSAVRWKICLKSWDRFQVPLPFVRCQITFGPALCVPREVSDAERESLRQQLEERLKRIA